MKNHLHFLTIRDYGILMLILILSITACTSPKRVMEDGRYDDAVDLAIRRIKGKKEAKLKHVLVLEEAYRKAHTRDLEEIKFLKADNRASNWPKIHSIYDRIKARQKSVDPFIPLRAEDGYLATFGIVDVGRLQIESREKAAEYFYDKAVDHLERGRAGDKYAAREALDFLNDIRPLYSTFRNVEELKILAVELGTEHWLISMTNESGVIMPAFFERELLSIGSRNLDDRWRKFTTERLRGVDYDYEVGLMVTRLDVSPEVMRERQYDESKEIEDGFEYVLDENGNVMKDTLGNDIKVTKYSWITATILEVHQVKSAEIRGRLMIQDLVNNSIVHTEPVVAGHEFDHYASTMIKGDRRALTKDSKSRLGSRPLPFPNDDDMILSTMEALKNELTRFLRGPHV